ncbi:MAG: WavE lipopolysaccharide synthesis [Gemmatimonadetes bacterium]|nr:WavE lipopolysaccharide synthesis [Gemmatimonadota bacterium]
MQSRDICVVVQGPVSGTQSDPPHQRLTARCLRSVRAHLPDAEIILSTWKGSDVDELDYDRLVESDDPGTMRCDMGTRNGFAAYYNANRQIVSTRNGLAVARRPYAIKMRSDMEMTGTGFLELFERYPVRAPQWRILGQRVVTADHFSRSLDRRIPYVFHPSDWFHFGRHEDVVALWDIDFASEEMVRWYDSHPRPREDPDWWLSHRFTVEQHNWLSFLSRHAGDHALRVDHKADVSGQNRMLSELTIVNNLVIAEAGELGIAFLKYPVQLHSTAMLYTHGEWRRLYQRYCDANRTPPHDWKLWGRRLYDAYIAQAHLLLSSPRSSPRLGAVSSAWQRRAPASFQLVKRAYLSGLGLLGRRPH